MKQALYQKIADYLIEHQNGLYRLAYSYTGNPDWLTIEAGEGENAVKTWCYRIVVNESMALLRKRRKESPVPEPWDAQASYIEKGYEQDDDLYNRVNRLPEKIQEVIKLRFYEDLSLKEIAEITETNLNTVKARLYRGLRMMKKDLEEAKA